MVKAYRDNPCSTQSFIERREDLIKRGFIKSGDSEFLTVLQDIPNSSLTAAVQLVCGGSGVGGPREWKHNGRMLRDIENQD